MNTPATSTDDILRRELATEQAHVDLVYRELAKARDRAELVADEGMSRGRTDRTGDIRDEEITGLFERDALMFNAGRRRASLDRQHEGLVFGRLDLHHDTPGPDGTEQEVRYIGRLGVRDDEYEALVIDWRAPAAAAFYRATPTEPMGVVRRRVLRSREREVIGIEDDLMVAEPPDDMVVLGDGALLAALGRSRTGGMRDIVATIQAHQDEAIRAPARGVTLITGGPGTGKTVVALHRAAYLLYSDRRRYEGGGVLVVGPSAAYTAYIERVLPSLGEDSVSLRSLGDVVEAVSAVRHDPPSVAAVKGSTRMVKFLARAARDSIPGAPEELRTFIAGRPVRLAKHDLDRLRGQVLRRHQRNNSDKAMRAALAQLAWQQVRDQAAEGDQEEFFEKFADSIDVDAFLDAWWRPVDPREVLLWCRDPQRTRRYGRDLLDHDQIEAFSASIQLAIDTATWSVADAALIDTLATRVGPVPEQSAEERGFYEVELLDDAEAEAVAHGALRASDSPLRGVDGSGYRERTARDAATLSEDDRLHILLQGRIDKSDEFAHILIDEAQDISPMQWRMIGRRGRWASWTVVGDAAQASWPDQTEATEAQNEAFGTGPRRHFQMTTNYRNAKEIFDVAAELIREVMPDADIPEAVRVTGAEPVQRQLMVSEFARPDRARLVTEAVSESLATLATQVDGTIAVITPSAWADALTGAFAAALEAAGAKAAGVKAAAGVLEAAGVNAELAASLSRRVQVLDAMTTKGLEYDATVVVDPDGITAESPAAPTCSMSP